MSLATEKDEVLTRLNEVVEVDLAADEFIFPEPPLQRFSDLFFKHRFELEHDGYIEYHESDGVLLDVQRARIVPAGRLFIQRGGYTSIEQNIQSEIKQKRAEWNWRRIYEGGTLITAVSALIIAILAYYSTPKNDDIQKIQLQINALKGEVKQLQKLKAVDKSANRQNILPPRRIPGR